MPIEWSMKSKRPPKCSVVRSISRSRSSTRVASAGTTIVPHFSARRSIVPMRIDTSVFVSTISAPSSTARSATFQAMDCSLSAPKMRPFFPFSRFVAIIAFINPFYLFVAQPLRRPRRHRSDRKRAVALTLWDRNPDKCNKNPLPRCIPTQTFHTAAPPRMSLRTPRYPVRTPQRQAQCGFRIVSSRTLPFRVRSASERGL